MNDRKLYLHSPKAIFACFYLKRQKDEERLNIFLVLTISSQRVFQSFVIIGY